MRVAGLERQGTKNSIRYFSKFNNASYHIRYSQNMKKLAPPPTSSTDCIRECSQVGLQSVGRGCHKYIVLNRGRSHFHEAAHIRVFTNDNDE